MKVKNIRKYLTEEQITERVKAMGEQISKDYGGETVYLHFKGIDFLYL